MRKLAVDICLLLPTPIMNKVIGINEQFENRKLSLNTNDVLPHITLSMGCIDEENLKVIGAELENIAKLFLGLKINVNKVRVNKMTSGEFFSSLVIERTKEIFDLHEEVIKCLQQFMSFDASKEMFYLLSDDLALNWVRNFQKTSALELFKPHVSLGLGDPKNIKLPISFQATKLAICQLGDYCSCRKVLFSTTLKTKKE